MTIEFKRIEEILKPEYYKEFLEFLAGQTVSVDGVYEDDLLRFVNKLGVID
jgi:hypothetical protein